MKWLYEVCVQPVRSSNPIVFLWLLKMQYFAHKPPIITQQDDFLPTQLCSVSSLVKAWCFNGLYFIQQWEGAQRQGLCTSLLFFPHLNTRHSLSKSLHANTGCTVCQDTYSTTKYRDSFIQAFTPMHVFVPKNNWLYFFLMLPGACCNISGCPLLAVLFVGIFQAICGQQGQYEVWGFSTELYLAFSPNWPSVRPDQVIVNTCKTEIGGMF